MSGGLVLFGHEEGTAVVDACGGGLAAVVMVKNDKEERSDFVLLFLLSLSLPSSSAAVLFRLFFRSRRSRSRIENVEYRMRVARRRPLRKAGCQSDVANNK